MSRHVLTDAFGHHAWATLRLIDSCLDLSDEQLAATVPGTYGSIIDTMRHLVEADEWYLFDILGDESLRPDDETGRGMSELRTAMVAVGDLWTQVLASDPDPDRVVADLDEERSIETRAPVGIRLAQALHHGTDHRSQICTALTTLGVEPPAIDVWDFGEATGRTSETPA